MLPHSHDCSYHVSRLIFALPTIHGGEKQWSTPTRICALSSHVTKAWAGQLYLRLKQENLWHKSCYPYQT